MKNFIKNKWDIIASGLAIPLVMLLPDHLKQSGLITLFIILSGIALYGAYHAAKHGYPLGVINKNDKS